MTLIAKLLAQSQVFGTLPPLKREELIRAGIMRRYRKGEIISYHGDAWPYLFMVTHGSVQALKESSEGRSLVVTTFNPGDIFWGLAFFYEDMPMLATLKARDATQIYLWAREQLLPLLKENGETSWQLARLMIQKMVRASEILEEMSFQPVAGRLAKLLMETVRASSQEDTITRSLTLEEMAARIGSTREMVCRFLHRFADDGLIDITRTEFRVTDAKRLGQLAGLSKG